MRKILPRCGAVPSGMILLGSSLMIVGMKPVPTALFANSTRQALTVLAKTTQLPLSAPPWLHGHPSPRDH